MEPCGSIGTPVLPASSLRGKQSWEGTKDMAPFPYSHDLTSPHGHTTQKHTLRSARCPMQWEAEVRLQASPQSHHQSIWHGSLSYFFDLICEMGDRLY